MSAHATTYENLELIVGFDEQKKVSLLGRSAHSSGYYSVTFNDKETLKKLFDAKKDDLLAWQLVWFLWVIANAQSFE